VERTSTDEASAAETVRLGDIVSTPQIISNSLPENNEPSAEKAYAYEVSEIEVLTGKPGSPESSGTSNTSISGSILLQGVRNHNGNLILEHSKVVDENGKPTNLTECQWVQVRTPSFKKWFGDWESSALLDLAEKAWDDKNFIDKFVFTPSDGLSQKLSGLLGHPVSQIVITADAVRHMKKHHGDSKTETPRGQIAMTAEDALLIPYIPNNFDDAVRVPASDMKHGEKAVEIRKQINGVAIVATIEQGKDKQFVVSLRRKVSAASMLRNASPKLNVRSATDIQMIQQEIAGVKRTARDSSKVVDENGEPLVVYRGSEYDPLAQEPGYGVIKPETFTRACLRINFDGAAVDELHCLNTCKTSFRQDLQDYQDYERSENTCTPRKSCKSC
jgi:hypothetical protein